MSTELGRVIDKQMEASPYSKKELEKGRSIDLPDVVDGSEKVLEVPKDAEGTKVNEVQLKEGTKVLQPDIDLIKSQSIEAVKQSNLEKTQAKVKEDNELRELTEAEKKFLRENTRLSDTAIENIRVDAEGNYYLKCRNEELAGKNHEVTGVKYVEKTITVDGVEITVVVPEFPSVFDCDIPAELWEAGDKEIFKECTEQLRDYLEAHPEMKSQFSEQQLEQIMRGEPYIKGYTWHHSEIPGKMQLVETKTHVMSGHTGGNSIWCGGIR